MKNNFIIDIELMEMAEELNETQYSSLFHYVFQYAKTKQEPEIKDLSVRIIFNSFVRKYKENEKKYQETCQKRSVSGKKGVVAKASKCKQNKQKQANQADMICSDNDVICNDIDKENNNIPAEKLPAISETEVVKPKVLTPQAELFEYFADKFRQLTGLNYLKQRKDFVLLANLIKQQGIDTVRQKIDFLYIACQKADQQQVFWFAPDKAAFTIGQLSNHFNEIIPKLTEEQKEQADAVKRREEIEINARRQLAERLKNLEGVPK